MQNWCMETIYDFTVRTVDGEILDLSEFRGRPVLVVNTASRCGFTHQYQGLQQLHELFGPRGLVVIAFPCDQFAHQEPGDDAEIARFCRRDHAVTFPISTKVDVNGRGTDPVFRFLKQRTSGLLGSAVKWNFTKFLVAPDGTTVTRYAPTVEPSDLARDVEPLLPAHAV